VCEELVQLLEHADTWLVGIFELASLARRDLVELVLYILKKVCKAARFDLERLVFSCAVATLPTVSPAQPSIALAANDVQLL
jgi:hypothetical protein